MTARQRFCNWRLWGRQNSFIVWEKKSCVEPSHVLASFRSFNKESQTLEFTRKSWWFIQKKENIKKTLQTWLALDFVFIFLSFCFFCGRLSEKTKNPNLNSLHIHGFENYESLTVPKNIPHSRFVFWSGVSFFAETESNSCWVG